MCECACVYLDNALWPLPLLFIFFYIFSMCVCVFFVSDFCAFLQFLFWADFYFSATSPGSSEPDRDSHRPAKEREESCSSRSRSSGRSLTRSLRSRGSCDDHHDEDDDDVGSLRVALPLPLHIMCWPSGAAAQKRLCRGRWRRHNIDNTRTTHTHRALREG